MKVCSIDGCGAVVGPKSARGLCRPHYRRLMKHGDPLIVKRGRPINIRFWEKVDKSSGVCWEWTGRKNAYGYGVFTIGHTEKVLAHRMSWELINGERPNLFCLHKCDNRGCVNPDHLFLGTQTENMEDMRAKGRGKNPPPGARWRTKE